MGTILGKTAMNDLDNIPCQCPRCTNRSVPPWHPPPIDPDDAAIAEAEEQSDIDEADNTTTWGMGTR